MPSANQQVVPPAQQAESVSDAMSLLQALSGGTAASEPDPVMPQKAQEVPSEPAEPAVTERAETAQTVKPVVVDMPAAASTAAAPKYSDDMTVFLNFSAPFVMLNWNAGTERKPIRGMRSSLRHRRCRKTGNGGSIRWVFRKTTSSTITAEAAQNKATAPTVRRKSH